MHFIDANSGGNMIFRIAFTADRQIDVGSTFRLEAGELDITAD